MRLSNFSESNENYVRILTAADVHRVSDKCDTHATDISR
jgi:hypothetical protein